MFPWRRRGSFCRWDSYLISRRLTELAEHPPNSSASTRTFLAVDAGSRISLPDSNIYGDVFLQTGPFQTAIINVCRQMNRVVLTEPILSQAERVERSHSPQSSHQLPQTLLLIAPLLQEAAVDQPQVWGRDNIRSTWRHFSVWILLPSQLRCEGGPENSRHCLIN